MNMAVILGVVRHILTALGGYVVAAGWVDDANAWTEVVGGIMVVAGFVWSAFFTPEKALPPAE